VISLRAAISSQVLEPNLFNNAVYSVYLDHDAATLQTAWKTYYLLTPSKHFQAEAWLSENCESCKVTVSSIFAEPKAR